MSTIIIVLILLKKAVIFNSLLFGIQIVIAIIDEKLSDVNFLINA